MAENGKLDTSTLVQAANGSPGQVLEKQTAAQWAWMAQDAAAAGVHLAPEPDGGIPSCYRDLAHQQTAYDELGYPKAAYPGQSNHGWGTAVDIAITSSVSYWLQQNASKYGFVNDVPGEAWHYHKVTDVTVPPISREDLPMFFTIQGKGGVINGGMYFLPEGSNTAHLLGAGGTTPTNLTPDQGVALSKIVGGIR